MGLRFYFIILGTALFLSAQVAVASESDKWGLKFRGGSYLAEHTVKSAHLTHSDSDPFSQSKFPLMIAFPPKNGKFTFSQIFFDYELPYESKNMNPVNAEKSALYNNFLTPTEQTFATNNADWTITADFKTWAIVGGYQYGIFFPLSNKSRIFKTSLGLTAGWYSYDVTLSQCSLYTPNPKKINGSSKQSGDCDNKTKMDQVKYSGPGLGGIVSVMLFEWYDRTWMVNIGYFEAGSITGLQKQKFSGRSDLIEFEISSTLISFDVFNIAYFF